MKSKDDMLKIFNHDVCFCDSTLTDGEKAAGVVFSNVEKYRIAELLDTAGVAQIIAGIPAMGGDDKVAVKHIANMGLNASIMAECKATALDVEMSAGCGVDSIVLTMPTSDIMITKKFKTNKQWVLEQITEAITKAKDQGLYVVCRAEDATRTDLMFLIEFAKTIRDAGANRFCYCDTIGREEPYNVFEKINSIGKIVGIDMEIYARNDFGMANAVSLAAVKGGAKFVTTTVTGIGERAGNTALEQAALACSRLVAKSTGINEKMLKPLADVVSEAARCPIDPYKPIIGSQCFTYESGMHDLTVSSENPDDEPFDPAELGLVRKMVIGKNSGTKTIIVELSKKGIEIKREDAEAILRMVRRATNYLHRSLTSDELVFIHQQYCINGDLFDDKLIE